MDVVRFPARNEWPALMQRAAVVDDGAKSIVAGIIAQVRQQGDEALRGYAKRFDGVELTQLAVTPEEFAQAALEVGDELKESITLAKQNIEKFHAAQRMEDITVETVPGVTCTQRAVAIPSVGLYIPGGNSPLFSTVLMLAVPARLAGCGKVVMCTPVGKGGKVHPAILYAAQLCGIDAVYKVGGAQAVAAMAYGTESIPKVCKIFGPGNRWVMEAKMQVNTAGVAIDMPAGPSEVMIVADGTADAAHVASDFLSQAEHGPDSQSILLTTSAELAELLPVVTEQLLNKLPRREMMERSLSHSHIVLLHDDDEMMEFANAYAPEHLIINHSDCDRLAAMVVNAGSVFLGPYSPESAGDYASGTNHTLPTSGYATAYSGVNLDSFIKKITFQRLTQEGIQAIGPAVMAMAEAEDLMAHRLAVAVRVGKE